MNKKINVNVRRKRIMLSSMSIMQKKKRFKQTEHFTWKEFSASQDIMTFRQQQHTK